MANESSTARFPLDAGTLQRLDNLVLVTRKAMATGRPGRRRSPLAGSSMEFADYRRYAPGDDFRRIDWRAYARLERLFLRIFEAEENLTVTILIDCSESMQYGRPAKASLATALAAALAYIALKCEDSVIAGALTDRLAAHRRVGRGKHAIWAVGEFLSRLSQSGATDLNRNHAPVCVNQEFVAPVRPTTDFRANEIDSAVLRERNDQRKDAATLQAPGRLKVLSGDYEDAILSALIAPNNNGVFRNQRRQPKFRRSRLFLWTHEVLSFLSVKIITILQQTDL